MGFRVIIIIFVAMMNDAMNRNMKEEPGRSERAAAWQTAIGLQAADRISTSDYLRQTSMKHVNGQISLEQVNQLLYRYYFEMNAQEAGDPETANRLYQYFNEKLRGNGVHVEEGIFQADMLVDIQNDGPVTLLLDSTKMF